jgi:hypothetical protein
LVEDEVTGFVVEDEMGAVGAVRHISRLSRGVIRQRFEERFTARRMAGAWLETIWRFTETCWAPRCDARESRQSPADPSALAHLADTVALGGCRSPAEDASPGADHTPAPLAGPGPSLHSAAARSRARRRAFQCRAYSARLAAIAGCDGNRPHGSENGPSQAPISRSGGSHGRRNSTPLKRNACDPARALLTKNQLAPAAINSAPTCRWVLLATPTGDLTSMKKVL